MPTFINIRTPLAQNSSANPLDVIKIKSGLSSLGHYASPDWGISKFPDSALFQAVRDFQKSQGLKVDGVMKPEGETLAALQSKLRGAKERTATQAAAKALQGLGRNGDKVLAHLTQGEAKLLHDITDGASINPQTGLLEFWQDYEAEAAGIGGQNNGPDKPSKPDKDNGGSNGGNSGGKKDNDFSFIGNFVEDLGNIFNGTATSPNSAYDERNADAKAAKEGFDRRLYLPGGKYGPGGASYNPFELHNAGVEMQTAAPGSLGKNGNGAVTTQALQSMPAEVAAPGVKTGAPAAVTPNGLPTMPDKTPAVAPVNQTGAQTSTKTEDLKAELAQAEAAAWHGGQTLTQQAANIHKIESLREEIKKAEEASGQKSKQVQLGNFENQVWGNTGNRADEFEGLSSTGAPKMSSANKASNLNFLDYEGDAYATHKTLAPASMADALMQNRKAANVGEQPIAPQDPSVANTLVEGLRTSTQTTRRNFMAQLENLVMRDPEALKSFHPEIESYYTAFQKSLHSAMAFRPEPRPSELNYEAKKKTYDVWAAKRVQQADLAGLNAAYSYHAAQGLGTPLAELGEKALSGADALDAGDPNAVAKAELKKWVDHAVPAAYQNAPLYLDDLKTGSVLAWGVDTFSPVGVLTAADDVAKTLQKAGMSKAVQVVGAKIAVAVHVVGGPLAKLSLKEAKPFLKAISAAIKQRFGVDLSQLTSREMESLVEALGEEGIQMTVNGTVKGVGDAFGDQIDHD